MLNASARNARNANVLAHPQSLISNECWRYPNTRYNKYSKQAGNVDVTQIATLTGEKICTACSTLLTMNKVDNTISKLCAVQVTKTQN